jgi:hypothetical protein
MLADSEADDVRVFPLIRSRCRVPPDKRSHQKLPEMLLRPD